MKFVLFVEFCSYVRSRVNPDVDPNFDKDIVSGEKCGSAPRHEALRRDHGHSATRDVYVSKKCFRQFDEMENKIRKLLKDRAKIREMWHRMDFNGNNIVSLAEIDKLVVETYPLLNHKPALMRAYKAATKKEADEYVHQRDFRPLLGHIFYFNKLFWLFDNYDGDKDRRLTYPEFKRCLTLCGAKMSEQEMRHDFSRVDSNGGGIILFDEFCKYFTQKAAPECFSDLMG